MPPNLARVKQENPAKIPILMPGDVTPEVMRDYTDACNGYFEQKEIPEDKQVRKILTGLKDTRIKDWLSADRACLQGLTFDEFITEFCENYLDEDWEEGTRRELLNISQGSSTFWDFATKLQAKNSLLATTTSHLNAEKLCHQLEAGMDERLSHRCTAEKVNKVVELKKWMAEVKRIDDVQRGASSKTSPDMPGRLIDVPTHLANHRAIKTRHRHRLRGRGKRRRPATMTIVPGPCASRTGKGNCFSITKDV
jgi:hypothetical protein